jgi:hypothetical protein
MIHAKTFKIDYLSTTGEKDVHTWQSATLSYAFEG